MRGNKVLGIVCGKHLEKKISEAMPRAVAGNVTVLPNMTAGLNCDYCEDTGEYIVSWMERPT